MGEVIVLTGGVRSGKSRRALELAGVFERKVFVATATASDDEMRERIARHRAERDTSWITIEEPLQLDAVLGSCGGGAVVIDCMTLWLANALEAGVEVETAAASILAAARARSGSTIFVTNEVGWGIVPEFESGRRFRDLAGLMNQRLAAGADEAWVMISGLALRLK